MRARDLLVLGGALAVAAALGTAVLGNGNAVERPPGLGPGGTPPDPAAAASPAAADQPAPDAPGSTTAAATVAAAVTAGPERVDTSNWTSGVVKGDIQIAVAVLDRIETISVVVEEMRNPTGTGATFRHPFRKIVPVEMGIGTPTFEVTGIPFSDHPYSVSLHVPGLNGGRRTVTIDQKTPLYDDLRLAITAGAPFSILVRDQHQNPFAKADVRLVPVGAPAGRALKTGVSDAFGSVVFEDVLEGDWRVVTSQQGVPLAPEQTVNVPADNRMYGPKVQGLSHVVVVQRGVPLTLQVSTKAGYGIADAKVQLQNSDQLKLDVLELPTDFAGRAEFPHLTPGRWLLHVTKQDYQPVTQQLTIKEGEVPPLKQIELVRLR